MSQSPVSVPLLVTVLAAHFLHPVFDKVLITFKPPRVLVASNGLGIVRNTRHAKYDSTTTGQAKLGGIEPSL